MSRALTRWDQLAVRLVSDQGWRNMPEAATIGILAAAHIPFSLLTLTFAQMLQQAGHQRVKAPLHHHDSHIAKTLEICAA